VAGLVVLVYALERTADHGWGSARTLVLLGLSAALLATFAMVERSASRPILPPRLWRMRSLVSSAAVMLGATGILVGTFFLNSVYLQTQLGASALETGLEFLPIAVAVAIAAHAASHLLPRAGSRVVAVAGLALLALGSLGLAAAPDHASYATDLLPAFVAIGAGVGLVFPTVSVTAMSDVAHDETGLASGMVSTAHEIGAALGVAILSAVATAAGGAAGSPAGYERGFVVAALIAAGLGAVAAVAMPSLRPAGRVAGPLH
jgi:predicted MFS family arabinose efflux permease